VDAHLAAAVRARAGHACEYCRVPQAAYPTLRFHVDHVIAKKHRGPTNLKNLALSCFACNGFKGSDIASNDPVTGRLTRLFNPRRQKWARHFRWDGARILGRTAVGRVTVEILNLNDEQSVLTRAALIREGLIDPNED
jgi:hypothetical protein